MANVPYKNQYTNNPKDSPTGKFPAMRDGEQCLSDSHLMIDHLKKHHGDPLDQDLTPAQKGIMVAFERLLSEHLYWGMVYTRWLTPEGWAVTEKTFFGKMPFILRLAIPRLLKRKVMRQLNGQGMGFLKKADLLKLCEQDIEAISQFLGDKPFFMGEQPTSIDASLYALLINILHPPIESPLKTKIQNDTTLTAYCERMKNRYWTTDEKSHSVQA